MNYFLGIDNGGTYTKAALYDENANRISISFRTVPLITPHPHFTERDMDVLYLKNAEVIKECIEKAEVDPSDILSVSFSGHGKGLYLWGKNNCPSYNGILSTDGRAAAYPIEWKKNGVSEILFKKTFQQQLACQPTALLCWFRDNNPKVLENTKWIFDVKDYLRYRLTGVAKSEITDCSGSGLVNLESGGYDQEILKALGLEELKDKLPPLCGSSDICGRVTLEASEKTGLAVGTICAGGLFDIDACSIAMNVTDSTKIACVSGTWSINEYVSDKPVTDGSVLMNTRYCIKDKFLVEESSPTGCGNLDWYLKVCNISEDELSTPDAKSLYRNVDNLVASVGADEQDIIFLPYINGSNYNAQARAGLYGMTSFNTKAHLLRAVFEGVAFAHLEHLEKLLKNNKDVRAIRLAGGVCNSKIWVGIFSDIFDMPIEIVKEKELGTFGAMLCAMVCAGRFATLDEASQKMVKCDEIIYPNKENAKIYKEKYKRFKQVRDALSRLQ